MAEDKKNKLKNVRKFIADIKSGEKTVGELGGEILEKARSFTQSPEQFRELLDFSSQFYNYSLNNCLLIHMQNPFASYVGSYQHFKDMHLNVKKGEHGIKIMVPIEVTLLKTDDGIKRMKDATKEEKMKAANGEIEIAKKTYFKLGTVFDIAQTNVKREDLPKIFRRMDDKEDSSFNFECMRELIEKGFGIEVKTQDVKSISLFGYYDTIADEITLSDRLDDTNGFKTLTHEFAHALLHKNSPDMPKAAKEFEAESVAYIVLKQSGTDLSDYSFSYISNYYGKMDKKNIDLSLKRINNAARFISTKFNELKKESAVENEQEAQQQAPVEEISKRTKFKHIKEDTRNAEISTR